jgi:hypothetical protein
MLWPSTLHEIYLKKHYTAVFKQLPWMAKDDGKLCVIFYASRSNHVVNFYNIYCR